MARKFNNADPTANTAIKNAGSDALLAAELRRRREMRERADAARNERIRQAREVAQDRGDGGAA